MDEPLDRDLLVRILEMVDLGPADMIRRGDAFDVLAVDPTSLDDPSVVVDLITPGSCSDPSGSSATGRSSPDRPIASSNSSTPEGRRPVTG